MAHRCRAMIAYTTLAFTLSILAVILAIVLSPLSWAKNTPGGGLIGERLISSRQDAFHYAEDGLAEASRIWEEDSNDWEMMQNNTSDNGDSLLVEARRITEGPFSSSRILLTRARAIIDVSAVGQGEHTADSIFQFLVSPEGFAVIDPVTNPEEFSKYVERFNGWRKSDSKGVSRLEVADAFVHLGKQFAERIFVVLNAIDAKERVFISKSVLHKDRPGASVYHSGVDNEDVITKPHLLEDGTEQVRALNTFGVRVNNADSANIGDKKILVEMINWADVQFHSSTKINSSLSNWINCKIFLGGLFDRLKEALA